MKDSKFLTQKEKMLINFRKEKKRQTDELKTKNQVQLQFFTRELNKSLLTL